MSVLDCLPPPRTSVAAGYELGVGRTVPSVAAVVGLVSVIVGGLALARSAGRTGSGTHGEPGPSWPWCWG